MRRGGEELGVQGRAHARVHGSGAARGGAWGKGDGEPSGARGVQHGRGRKEREGRREGRRIRKKEKEGKWKKSKRKRKGEEEREIKGEKASAHRRNSRRPLRPGQSRAPRRPVGRRTQSEEKKRDGIAVGIGCRVRERFLEGLSSTTKRILKNYFLACDLIGKFSGCYKPTPLKMNLVLDIQLAPK